MNELRKFPPIKALAWKSTKEQKWNTVVKTAGSGRIRTMTTWQYPQYVINTQFAYLTPAQYKEIMGFFSLIKGGTEPFLWLDPEDYEEINIQLGVGSDGAWQAVRRMGDYVEPVSYVEDIVLYADGQRLEHITQDKGVIHTTDTVSPEAIITADYTYYWKVRLDGSFTAEATFKDIYKSKSFKLVTVR